MDVKLSLGQALRHETNQLENSQSVIVTMPDGETIQISHFSGNAWEVWQVPTEERGKPCCLASSNHIPDRHFNE